MLALVSLLLAAVKRGRLLGGALNYCGTRGCGGDWCIGKVSWQIGVVVGWKKIWIVVEGLRCVGVFVD